MAEETTFEALYRIEQDGSRFWIIQLENGQIVTVSDDDVRLYPNKDSVTKDKLMGSIPRKVKGDEQTDDPETGITELGRLL